MYDLLIILRFNGNVDYWMKDEKPASFCNAVIANKTGPYMNVACSLSFKSSRSNLPTLFFETVAQTSGGDLRLYY